jgi:hypothetical protein
MAFMLRRERIEAFKLRTAGLHFTLNQETLSNSFDSVDGSVPRKAPRLLAVAAVLKAT